MTAIKKTDKKTSDFFKIHPQKKNYKKRSFFKISGRERISNFNVNLNSTTEKSYLKILENSNYFLI